jgi:hypothetical protein
VPVVKQMLGLHFTLKIALDDVSKNVTYLTTVLKGDITAQEQIISR